MKNKKMEMMNVIINPHYKQAHIFSALEDTFYYVSLDLDDDFLKRTKLQKVRGKRITKNYVKKKLATASIKLQLKVHEGRGVYLQVNSKKTNKILLSNRLIMSDNDNINFKLSGIAWSSAELNHCQ